MSLYQLIEWAEAFLKKRKDIAHGFRILRNLIHEDKIVDEHDILEAVRHVSIILNTVFPLPEAVMLSVICDNCRENHSYSISTLDYFLGNNMLFRCDKFKQDFNVIMIP